MTSSEPPPPGWYEDPENAAQSRWWTGSEWGPRAAQLNDPKDPSSTSNQAQADGVAGPANVGSEIDALSAESYEDRLARAWAFRQEAIRVAEDMQGASKGDRALLELRYHELRREADALDASIPKRSAGWFPDPQDEDRIRYWDGHGWNDNQAADDLSEQAEPDQGEPDSATAAASQMAGISVAKKPLTTKKEKTLSPGSKELGIAALVALGVGSGALAGFRIWTALVAAAIVIAAIVGHKDLLHRSPNHANPARSDGRQLAVFWSAWITAALLFAVGSTSTPNDSATDTPVTQEAAESKSSTVPEPEPKTQTVEEEAAPDEEPASLESLLVEALGSPNRDVSFLTEEPGKRVVLVEDGNDLLVLVALNDNLSSRLIRSSAQRDTVRVAETMQQQPDFNGTLTLSMYFPLVDQFGNAQETVVVTVSYTRDTLDRINFSNLIRANIWDIADLRQIHPTLQD